MASLFSPLFLVVFLPAVIVAYSLTPARRRWITLLIASYTCFFIISQWLIVFIAVSTVSVWLLALGIERIRFRCATKVSSAEKSIKKLTKKRYDRSMRFLVLLGILFNLALLMNSKYLGFFGGGIKDLLGHIGLHLELPAVSLAAPIGISFYTLMAISYLVDVYRKTVCADKNLGHVALFLSFFPQIIEGPFCRFNETMPQLLAGSPVRASNLLAGMQRILFGLFKKVIIADRLDILVKTVFGNPTAYDGGSIALAAILYTLELYCDFSGAMDVTVGTARIFGITMPENFRQPFFSRTSSEFWKRWHVTLGAWFRDYIYYPVTLCRPIKRLTKSLRRRLSGRLGPLVASSVALFCVWLLNGLWHGAGSQYLFFGMYYFVLITLGGLVEPLAQRYAEKYGVNRSSLPYRTFQTIRTLMVIFVGELFFRAEGLDMGVSMFIHMITKFRLESFCNKSALNLGMDVHDYMVVVVALGVVFLVDISLERGAQFWHVARKQPLLCGVLCIALFMSIVIFGAYGWGYTPVAPMYAQF